MMRVSALLFTIACGILTGELSSVHANNFHRDVVSRVAKKERRQLPSVGDVPHNSHVEDELLSKAMPLSKYNDQLKALGRAPLPSAASDGADGVRKLEEGDENADDYYINEQNMYSFSGYSLKYAKCQPVQQFSSEALAAGEYSPMVTQDIVILRLCPYKSCSSSRQYGCHYNYAEYAIGLNEYIRIMLRYKQDKKERLCEWCAQCNGEEYNNNNERRKLEENQQQDNGQDDGQDNNGENNNNNNANNNNGGDDDYYAYGGQDDGYNGDDNNNQDDNANYNNGNYNNANYYDENDECYMYGSYCENYYYDCQAEDGEEQQNQNQYYYDDQYNYNQQQNDNYVDEEEFLNYLGCVEIADNYGGVYFVRPSCDVSEDKITMAIFYDEYCSQYAGDKVSTQNFDVAFDESILTDFYDGSCIDCSESNYPPGFNANSYMCNKLHDAAADCTSNMIYDLFDGQQSESTECSFIESIRFGTYDENGEIAVYATDDAEETVTNLQKLGLAGSAVICAIFVVYACYLHHSMTNLLIKSLSHRELLPPSRHSRRRSPKPRRGRRSSSRGSRGGRMRDEDDDEEDWEPSSKSLRSPV